MKNEKCRINTTINLTVANRLRISSAHNVKSLPHRLSVQQSITDFFTDNF